MPATIRRISRGCAGCLSLPDAPENSMIASWSQKLSGLFFLGQTGDGIADILLWLSLLLLPMHSIRPCFKVPSLFQRNIIQKKHPRERDLLSGVAVHHCHLRTHEAEAWGYQVPVQLWPHSVVWPSIREVQGWGWQGEREERGKPPYSDKEPKKNLNTNAVLLVDFCLFDRNRGYLGKKEPRWRECLQQIP